MGSESVGIPQGQARFKGSDGRDGKEHCSADCDKLSTIGRVLRYQVRIKRNDDEYGLYTVSEVRQENPDNIVRLFSEWDRRLRKPFEGSGFCRRRSMGAKAGGEPAFILILARRRTAGSARAQSASVRSDRKTVSKDEEMAGFRSVPFPRRRTGPKCGATERTDPI
jgi:hypothetical protein